MNMSFTSMVRTYVPRRLRQCVIRLLPNKSVQRKIAWNLFDRPNYAYGVYHAALQARRLGLRTMSVIEFGVASGNGLISLERISEEIGHALQVDIQAYGFDTGEGLPQVLDYRDLPYVWKPGVFKMDVPKLTARLSKAKLVLGNLEQTACEFIEKYTPAPIGFISFDVDYYSSTRAAFKIFDSPLECFLPRVLSYFDDVVGDDCEIHSEYTGELLAIREFNDEHKDRKIAAIHGFQFKTLFVESWIAGMYVTHLFSHPQYCQFVNPKDDWLRPLK